ncbi:hypothetical protein [Sphingomonas lenta]|uniref:Terminase n=1 Tax=Sphingomonas lenta TaxID=1141887 RepID=A0A2A2SBI0_9SPHN|nr:hypothetical protein [Sphingomonas lenta]PAX06532.1 hypothetical protein CKY28_15365 [Sphingomonas lenta]
MKAAAREAGVGTENAYAARRRRPDFAADWARARAEGAARLEAGETPVLAPDQVVRASRHGRPRVETAGPGRWSAAAEARFLETLAATCNVAMATRAAGVSAAAVYRRRRDWPGFAERWREALAHGWARLEALLVERASATLEGPPDTGGDAAPAMTVDQVITVYRMHQASVTGEGKRPRHDWRRREPSIEQVRDEVLKRVRALGG